ncbi:MULTISPECIES: hypothetical protein [unclassified Amycolatopsis]|uniref:hypothetical protein n=1 Tax=unclassified Amycolatopsis TaxID=2618356 RepID=UPI002875BC71|nr:MULTISPECIES: hypothetical protein [unclassified Amycolatopsis]MDS0136021.1 hypothetical protein [Amycolatopsis sp. 505]MDS0145390.1 hypothetical protein [Amycolatopsis sp. CM201R]
MKLPAVPGITPVTLDSVERTTAELHTLMARLRGPDAARDLGLEAAAVQCAEIAHEQGAGLLALVEHRDADPALLIAGVVPVDDPGEAADLGHFVADTTPGIREVSTARTGRGYPVVIVERIGLSGAQLQAVVLDPDRPRAAMLTLHSPGGRGWLEVAGLAGTLVAGVDLTPAAPAPGTRAGSGRSTGGTSARSAGRW